MSEMSELKYLGDEINKIDVSYLLERPNATPLHRTREMCADKLGAFVVLVAAAAYQTAVVITDAARNIRKQYDER